MVVAQTTVALGRWNTSENSHYKVRRDARKRYPLFPVLDHLGSPVQGSRVNHEPATIRPFLSQFPQGTPVDPETLGNR